MSAATVQVIERVARALGDRDGTGPDDTPWLRAQRAETRAASRAEGYDEGRVGVMEALARRLPASRGSAGAGPRLDPADLRGVTDEEVVDALLRSEDEADFRARLALMGARERPAEEVFDARPLEGAGHRGRHREDVGKGQPEAPGQGPKVRSARSRP